MSDGIWVGAKVRVSGQFHDLATGDPVDPAAVVFTVKPPSGSVVIYTYGVDAELVKDATGGYHVDVDASIAGTWRYRWHSTGTYQAAEEGAFDVMASLVG
ncbi:MAG: hypothetical protein AB7P52_17845 [Alphaproteobacteria bacterium]